MNAESSIEKGDRVPIANEVTEGALIGALLVDNRQIDIVGDMLRAEDFYSPFYRAVYETALHERGLGNAVHPGSLRRTFGDEAARALVDQIGTSGVVLLGAKDFAREIKRLARKRRLVEGLEAVVAEARAVETFEVEVSPEDLIARTEEAIVAASEENCSQQHLSAADCVSMALEYDGYGITSGILALDTTLGPIMLKDLTIGAGRPGMCKTGTGLSYAIGAAQKGHGVLFVSLEMSGLQLGARIAADWCFDRGDRQVPFECCEHPPSTVTQQASHQVLCSLSCGGQTAQRCGRHGSLRIGSGCYRLYPFRPW